MRSLRRGALAGALMLTAGLAGALAAAESAADPTAVVVRVSGAVQVQRAGGGAAPASPGMALAAGDRIIPSGGGQAVLLYRTGKKETATEAVTIEEPKAAGQAGAFGRAVATLNDVAAANARTDPNRQGAIRPIPGTPTPIAPRNDLHVLSARPTFVWFRVPEATGYTVQIQREGAPPVRHETGSADTVWTLPASVEPLEAGAVYRWTVAPSGGGRPGQPVRFHVVGEAEAEALDGALAELAEIGLDPQGDGMFLAALVYRDAGLYYEAQGLIQRLAAESDTSGRAFHLLRGEVLDALGDLDAAAAAFAQADAAPAE